MFWKKWSFPDNQKGHKAKCQRYGTGEQLSMDSGSLVRSSDYILSTIGILYIKKTVDSTIDGFGFVYRDSTRFF